MSSTSTIETEILQIINLHRGKLNKPALIFHDAITKVCIQHNNNIAEGIVPFGHKGFEERAKQLKNKINITSVAENMAMGQNTAEEVVKCWLNSEQHCKNIEGEFNLTGISLVKNEKGENIFTQIFIKTSKPFELSETSDDDYYLVSSKMNDCTNDSILSLINKQRQTKQLSALKIHSEIESVASKHAENMANNIVPLSHNGFEERAKHLMEKIGVGKIAENVAMGDEDVEQIVHSWLSSEAHKKNIEGDYTFTGFGIAKDSNLQYYYCQIFVK
jgi:uncharacterized protein YkwD